MERKIEKQLNRIAFMAGVPGLLKDERKSVDVLRSIFMQAEKMDFVILTSVKRKVCVVCDCLERNEDERKLDCGHFVCSFDCLAEMVNTQNLSQPKLTCPLKSCEISTPKSKLINSPEEEQSLSDLLILCQLCNQGYQITTTLKLPCSHRFCSFCLITMLFNEDPFFQNKCLSCFSEIPITLKLKLKSIIELQALNQN
jgi:hypothetical protein